MANEKRSPTPRLPKQTRPDGDAALSPQKDYSYLADYDAEKWYFELIRLYELSLDYDLRLHEPDPSIKLLKHAKGGRTTTTVVHIPLPTVQFVSERPGGFWLAEDRLPALIINVKAPDAVIYRELKLVLKSVRKHIKPPVANRGRYDLNTRFDAKTFAKWRADKIVQFVDSLAFNVQRKREGQRPYSQRELWARLGKNSKKETEEAKSTLRKALASLPSFGAQIAQDAVSPKAAEDAMSARIAKHMKRRS
jgi:hypothetical protein